MPGATGDGERVVLIGGAQYDDAQAACDRFVAETGQTPMQWLTGVRVRHAQQLRDDRDGQRFGVLAHQIELWPQCFQLLLQNGLNARGQSLHPPGRERQLQQPTEARVLRRFAFQHVIVVEGIEIHLPGVGGRPAQFVPRVAVQGAAPETFVPQHGADVRVPRQHQTVQARIEKGRRTFAQFR